MVRLGLHISLLLCLALSLFGQVADYPVDLQLLKTAEITNFSAINSENFEFSPTLYNDGVIYVSSRPRVKKGKKKSKQHTFDLKYYDLVKETEATDFYEKDINDLHHFGPCAFNPHGSEIFFSENYTDRKGADGRYHMKLIRALFEGDSWKIVDDFPFNSSEYSILHPAISKDGQTLVFASNMPGGYGKMDLYYITKTKNGWSLPINLGPAINSESNDVFPTFFGNDYVFYSSSTPGGENGLDIFVCKFIEGEWRFPQRLGEPINSKMDDIGFALSEDASYGFFSSNRAGGKGEDDIYKFELVEPIVFEDLSTKPLMVVAEENSTQNSNVAPESISGSDKSTEKIEQENFQFLIIDQNSNNTISDVQISLTPVLSREQINTQGFKEKYIQRDQATGKLKLLSPPDPSLIVNKKSILSGKEGKVNINLDKDQVYLVEFDKSGYQNEQLILDVNDMKYESAMFISLSKKSIAVSTPAVPTRTVVNNSNTNIPTRNIPTRKTSTTNTTSNTNKPSLKMPAIVGELLVFENLLYDYNKATIKKGGNKELQELANYMQRYPHLEVELSAHTDAIGSAPYNLNLSQKRAEVAKQFLVDHGIESYRIVAKGYGEQVIRNHCVEGVICTDDEHAYNRRTELKITKR